MELTVKIRELSEFNSLAHGQHKGSARQAIQQHPHVTGIETG